MKDNKFIIRCIIYSILILLTSILSFFVLKKGFNDKQVVNINLNEQSNVDYKVYLKENKYFEGKFLTKDNANNNMYFITSLIDYVDLDFSYNLKFDKKVSGVASYYVKAVVEANKLNDASGKYWSKEYNLTDIKTVTTNDNAIDIKENVAVDYDKYNNLLTGFKQQYGLSVDGLLKIILVVDNKLLNEDLTNDINRKQEVTFSIPLSQLAVQATVNSSNDITNDTISEINRVTSIKYVFFKVFGLLFVAVDVLFMMGLSNSIQKYKLHNLYNITLKKILSSYDSIVVDVKNKLDTSNYDVAYVKSFEELLDAHNEVRMPINFYESETKSSCEFYLINDKFAWVYRLEDKKLKHNR